MKELTNDEMDQVIGGSGLSLGEGGLALVGVGMGAIGLGPVGLGAFAISAGTTMLVGDAYFGSGSSS